MFTVCEWDNDLLLLGHPTKVAKFITEAENILPNLLANVAEGDIRCAVGSLAAARGANADPDPSVALLIDRPPPLNSVQTNKCTNAFASCRKGWMKLSKGDWVPRLNPRGPAVFDTFKGRFRPDL